MQNAEAISRVIEIVRGRLDKKPIVVVSAMSKVTDLLYKISAVAGEGDFKTAEAMIEDLRMRHLGVCENLLEGSTFVDGARLRVNEICNSLLSFVKAVCEVGDLSPRSMARIISRGEVLSSTIISFAMNARGISTNLIDAGRMVITNDEYMKGEPDIDAICSRAPAVVAKAFKGMDAVITQGFVAATADGRVTVLGRGGSDYSASLIGMAVKAKSVEIWTDVNGVMTADPRVVSKPISLPEISFEEAAEMAHFGAKVLHPMTIEPAVKADIPIYVLNSMSPSDAGTGIFRSSFIRGGVKSVSSKENILVINIFSTKMINVSGFLSKVFRVFSDNKVSVDLIGTSEASISVTVDASTNIDKVVEQLSAFSKVRVDRDKAQVSVIGKDLIWEPGIFRSIFTAVEGKRIYMISQGSSFINISLVVDRDSCKDVVRAIHKGLFE